MSDPKACTRCLGTGHCDEDDRCERCEGTGIEPDAEPITRDEFLIALREAWDDVQHHRTHILRDFTDFFKDKLGEE